jgi:hypothetical protein
MFYPAGPKSLDVPRIQQKGASEAAKLASEERRTQAEIAAENLRHGVSEQAETQRAGMAEHAETNRHLMGHRTDREQMASDERQNTRSESASEWLIDD